MSPVPMRLLSDNCSVGDAGQLIIGGCDTLDLIEEFGSPLFVYDEDHMRSRCRDAVEAFGDNAAYASKAFLCKAMAKLAYEEGMKIDVCTGGEIFVTLEAGIPAEKLVFHGNNKSDRELRYALKEGVGRIIVDSFDELDRLDRINEEGFPVPKVLLRVTPGVKAETHKFVATGHDDSKFGFTVSTGMAAKAVKRAMASSSIDLVGIHAHVGSQVFAVENFARALEIIAEFSRPLGLPELVIGGGLGVPYVEAEEAATLSQWCKILKDSAESLGVKASLGIEPGRSIVAAAATTIYTIGTIKELDGIRTYVAVDGGMSDNPRPVLYGSGYETFAPANVEAERTETVRLVGKHCESGDVIVEDAKIPAGLEVGDLIANPVTGGYGFSMASNYNRVLKPAIVFVRDGNARLVVRRETYADSILTDLG